MSEKNIDILDLLIVLARHKTFIVISTFLVSLFFIIYSLLAPQYWRSSVNFTAVGQDKSPYAISQNLLGGIGASFLGGDAAGNSLNYISILRSRTFSEEIIAKFDLVSYMKIKDTDPQIIMEKAVKELNEEILFTGYDIDTGIITITVETKDKALSSAIANTYYDLLEEYYLNKKMSKGRERRMFLEKQIDDFEANYQKLTAELEEFQREHNVVDLDSQKEATIKLYSEIVAKKMEIEVELDYSRKFMAEDSQQIKALTERLKSINESIDKMEKGDSEIIPNYIVNIDGIPSLSNKYLQMSLNLEIQKMIVSFLYPQFEQAKLDELNDISSFEVIDRAVPAGLRSKPRRARMVIIAFGLAFIVSSLFAYTFEILTASSRKDKLDAFFSELKRIKK
ncbi:MAG: Wzz/FepE/Etk N-terminal domain-containing protein [Candidatus Cloacimonas sp.]